VASKPTAKTLERLREMGFEAGVVERRNRFSNKTLDLFGCIDIVAVYPGVGVLGIQATSGTNHAARRTKSIAEPRLRTWLLSGGRFEIWSWSKKGPRGKRKLWTLRRDEVVLDDLDAEPETQPVGQPEQISTSSGI
jgi:hypothetical protein